VTAWQLARRLQAYRAMTVAGHESNNKTAEGGFMRTHLISGLLLSLLAQGAMAQSRIISSLGRIEPEGGVVRLAGPAGLGSVIMDLKVKEGDQVEAGQVGAG